jgi:hypothetical protein
MASTYSSNKIELIGTGDQDGTWGTSTNTNWQAMEQMVAGVATLNVATFTANTYTLTYTNTNAQQDARAMAISVTGSSTSQKTLVLPNTRKLYLISNNTTSSNNSKLRIQSYTGTREVFLGVGQSAAIYVDITALTVVGSNTPLISLSNTPAMISGNPSFGNNYDMTFTLTSNTQLTISVKGTDGVVRTAALTLA